MERFKVGVMCLAVLFTIGIMINAEAQAGPNMGAEQLLFENVPMVVSAAKKLQPITKAPASVYVVTAEDIKQSGSINVWDALREVPGMDVATTTIGEANVSLRGFNDILTNKTLLLVDGRSMYSPLQGFILWEAMTIQPEEIDRIEVVKGPVASLYGANANLGLINVITKTPEQLKGVTIAATGGTKTLGSYTFIYGGKHEDLSYKVSGGYKGEQGFTAREKKDALNVGRGNMELKYKIADNSEISFSGGSADSRFNTLTNCSQIDNLWYYGPLREQTHYLQSEYRLGGLKSRFFWNYENSRYDTAKRHINNVINVFDEETTYSFTVGDKHSAVVGAGGKLTYAKSDIFSADNNKHSQGIWDVFVQDEYALHEKLTLVGSARVDYYALFGLIPSGRLAAIYPHDENNLFRTSIGYSFRAPTLTDTYMAYFTPDIAFGLPQTTWGYKELNPETYLTAELGYQGNYLERRLRPFVDVFWTKINDLIDAYATGGGALTLDQTFRNLGRAYSSGFELGTEYDLDKQWTLIGNYAYNNVAYQDTQERCFSPKNKINLGFKWKGVEDKLSVKLLAHYSAGAESNALSGTGDKEATKSYIMANLFVGYQLNNNVELSLSGYNITHDVHVETPGGDKLGTRILGSVKMKF